MNLPKLRGTVQGALCTLSGQSPANSTIFTRIYIHRQFTILTHYTPLRAQSGFKHVPKRLAGHAKHNWGGFNFQVFNVIVQYSFPPRTPRAARPHAAARLCTVHGLDSAELHRVRVHCESVCVCVCVCGCGCVCVCVQVCGSLVSLSVQQSTSAAVRRAQAPLTPNAIQY